MSPVTKAVCPVAVPASLGVADRYVLAPGSFDRLNMAALAHGPAHPGAGAEFAQRIESLARLRPAARGHKPASARG